MYHLEADGKAEEYPGEDYPEMDEEVDMEQGLDDEEGDYNEQYDDEDYDEGIIPCSETTVRFHR